jgi:hypothetical protein
MATFRCKRSGNTVSFTNENDIAGLRAHEGYVEVTLGVPNGYQKETCTEKDAGQDANEKVLKKRGRPRKEVVSIFD